MAASTLPPHVSSFEKFNDEIPNDELVALVAFGFFMESERQWIECQKVEPGVD
jgi:hypothetical protein